MKVKAIRHDKSSTVLDIAPKKARELSLKDQIAAVVCVNETMSGNFAVYVNGETRLYNPVDAVFV